MGKTIGSNFNITPPDVGIGSNSRQRKTITTKHLGFAALATTCASLAAFSSGVYADTVSSGTQEVGGRLAPNSVTVSTDGNVSIDIVRNANPTLAVGKGTVTVTAGSGGYQLYISGTNTGSNGYTSLYYDGDINASSKIEGFNVDTPTVFSSAHTNQWGYAVASEIAAETGFSDTSTYNSILATGATVDTPTINNLKWKGISNSYKLLRTTNSAVSNSTTDIYYGIYTNSNDLTAGNYKNSVVYTAFVDGANTLNITPFAIDSGGTMTITAEYQSSEFPVPDASRISVALRDGNTSVGTCDNIAIVDHGNSNLLKFTCQANITDTSVAGKVLDTSVTVKMPNTNSELNYTAEDSWGYYIAMNGVKTMQEAAVTNACANVDKYSITNTTYHLQDTRTSKWYLVRKLEDGNCWMTQNLYFPASTTGIITQNGNNYTLPTSSHTGFSSAGHRGNGWYDGGDNGHKDNTPDADDNTGSFFGWMVATAGTGNLHGETALVSPTVTGGAIASDSVCPQGWKLPTGAPGGDFDNLYTVAYNSDNDTFYAHWSASFIGYCGGSSCPTSRGTAIWYSATQYDSVAPYRLYIDTTNGVIPTNAYNKDSGKGFGDSVRCMLSSN